MAKVTLAGARKSAGFTQEEMAEKLGISRSLMINLESGKAELKPYYFLAICSITGFDPDDFLLPCDTTKRNI